MLDEASIVRQLHRERTFKPPYCPRPSCRYHQLQQNSIFWVKDGTRPIKRFPYQSQRFRCKACQKSFGASFFALHFGQKIWGLNKEIFELYRDSASMRKIARKIKHDERMVRDRLVRMARFAILTNAKLTENLKIQEPIVFDGLENFSFSQYEPNNINHAVGKESLFIYDFNLAPINRKGRMSPWQREKKKKLESVHGPFDKGAIRSKTKQIFERLLNKTNHLVIFSDCHYQYARVVQEDLKHKKIEHIKVSSKLHRNFKNHLFAVNNVDMQARHDLSAFKRETIAFSKHPIAMQEAFSLYAIHRNYMRPKFYKKHKTDPFAHTHSPAMILGLTNKILSFEDFFSLRIMPTHVSLHNDAKNLYHRIDHSSRRPIRYMP